MEYRSFNKETISKKEIDTLKNKANTCRGDILKMTSIANSGHPGGSMSSIDMLTVLYEYAHLNNDNPCFENRDRIIISNGHISPAVYSILGRNNYFDIDDAVTYFRKAGYPFEGHVDRKVPGVELISGNLGQGFSSAVGIALANKVKKNHSHTFVMMGDGEQQKGQIVESRRVARKYNLSNMTVLIDFNQLQISGSVHDIMIQDLKNEYEATGWEVIEINGHDYKSIYETLRYSVHTAVKPVAIIAKTIMGKGVSFMKNEEKWHGQALSEEQLEKALKELNIENNIKFYKNRRKEKRNISYKKCKPVDIPEIDSGTPIIYSKDKKLDNRTAFGNALLDLADSNKGKISVFDCDLSGSVRTNKFAEKYPEYFFQLGIQEHSTASISAGMSINGLLTFWADFGVFAADEVFNQNRLNEINQTNLKIVATHLGLNVGEDGKTHHALNYIGLMRAYFRTKLILPADPNQTDKIIRYIATKNGNYFIGMGRSKTDIILDDNGEKFFGEKYNFEYGKIDIIRKGNDAVILTYGSLLPSAIKAHERLLKKNIKVMVLNVSSPLNLDKDVLSKAVKIGNFFTYEDHNVYNGLGSLIANYLVDNNIKDVNLHKMGVKEYGKSGSYEEVYKFAGLSVEDLVKNIEKNI